MRLPWRAVLLLSVFLGAACAQTATEITLKFLNGTGSGDVNSALDLSAAGTLTPFGAAKVHMTGGGDGVTVHLTFTFTFTPSGDTLTASAPSLEPTVQHLGGQASITGGTGQFANSAGSFSVSISVDDGSDPSNIGFSLTGGGSIVLNAGGEGSGPQVCEGGVGGTLPILVNGSCSVLLCESTGGSTLPIYRKGPSPDSTAPADTPPSSGETCTVLTIDIAGVQGGSTLPVLVFEGGGSTLPVLVYDVACCGGTGGTLPVLTFEGAGGTLPVLTFEGGGSTSPVDRPCTDCFAVSPAAASGTPIEIVTPLQSTAATYTAMAGCPDAPTNCWLTVPDGTGRIKASSSAAITAFANPQGLKPGVYSADVAITITPSGAQSAPTTLKLRVTLADTAAGPALALSQTGLYFQATSTGATPAPQSISISNAGSGSMPFSAVASTISGGNWLAVSPASGTATATSATQVSIQTSPAGLAPGTYSGRVDFNGPGVVNSTQSVVVTLTVAASSAAPAISIAGLIFTAGGAVGSAAPQIVQLTNPSNQPLTVSTKLSFAQGTGWFTATASASTLTSAPPLTETITVNPAGLAPGVYVATLDIHFAETNTDHPVAILLVVPKAGTSCTPTQLLAAFTNLEGGFQRTAGVPVPLDVQVVDDCGSPLTGGTVVAYLDNGDPAVALLSIGQGHWAGTWLPHSSAGGPVKVGVMATSSKVAVYGSAGVVGTVAANKTAPMVNLAGTVSAASLVHGPIAPGSFLSIFGSNLASQPGSANTLPFPASLSQTSVLLGGVPLPLQVAVNGQVNAVVPYDVPVGSTQQLIVQQNGIYSLPETVVIAASQPAVFTQDQSGKGAGVITVVKPDGTQFNNTVAQPASAGDALVIYCAGLGLVTPVVAAGSAAPASPPAHTINPVTVTIGGQSAEVLFAGLAPGFAGLYQVDVRVPKGIGPGAAVPLVLSVSGASSPPVTVAIQ